MPTAGSGIGSLTYAPNAADKAIGYALAQVGKPYKYGATGPDSYDCSGLVQAAFAQAGIRLPRTTYAQVTAGSRVAKASLAPGDLVFPDPGHVQIYLGNGKVVEAPHTGAKVRVMNMWGFWTARRVTTPATATSAQVASWGLHNPFYDSHGNPFWDPNNWSPLNDQNGNPIGPNSLGTVDATLSAISDSLQWIQQPGSWLRIAEFTAGIALLIIGLIGMSRVMNVVKKTGKVAQNATA